MRICEVMGENFAIRFQFFVIFNFKLKNNLNNITITNIRNSRFLKKSDDHPPHADFEFLF
jgi:hypothetical protein